MDVEKSVSIEKSTQENVNSHDVNEESKLWLEEHLIPKLKVILNQKNSVSQYEVRNSEPLIVSSMIFLELKLTSEKEENNFSLVLKRLLKDKAMAAIFRFERLFHNEILFYGKYVKDNDYPRCLYTEEDPPINSVIVIENINNIGYHACPEKVNLNMKYIIVSVQEIGRFHAKAYALKHNSPEEFFQIVNNIQETRYECSEKSFFQLTINNLMTRVIKQLRVKNYDSVFCEKADKFFKNAFDNCMIGALNPKIPLATLCHGDFTVNNIFFKENESGLRAMLFDFAMISYGSPAIDISTFIYLSMSPEDIRTKFTEVFDAYYNSLIDYLEKIGFPKLHSNEFSKESFLQDYKRYALFGFMIASFYLPIMYGEKIPDFDYTIEMEKAAYYFCEIGGDNFRDTITEMLLDMRKSGCLDHILS